MKSKAARKRAKAAKKARAKAAAAQMSEEGQMPPFRFYNAIAIGYGTISNNTVAIGRSEYNVPLEKTRLEKIADGECMIGKGSIASKKGHVAVGNNVVTSDECPVIIELSDDLELEEFDAYIYENILRCLETNHLITPKQWLDIYTFLLNRKCIKVSDTIAYKGGETVLFFYKNGKWEYTTVKDIISNLKRADDDIEQLHSTINFLMRVNVELCNKLNIELETKV